jgi:hypothetical protein
VRKFSYNLILTYVLIVFGIYLLAAASYDEYRGATTKPVSFHRRGMLRGSYVNDILVRRTQNPELFGQFMLVHWIWAVGIEGVGWILYIRNKE